MALFIGLMSGTSMDAVDAALMDFDGPELASGSTGGRAAETTTVATAVATHSAPIPEDLKHELHALAQDPSAAALRFWIADARLGALFADAALALLDGAGVGAGAVTAIGSHGQTVYHAPRAAVPCTVQIGDPNVIAERTGITTVADFRRRDVAAGGEGAPLAPAFHRAVFSAAGVERGILNLGGIANLSVLPADPGAPPRGFDTGPGNTLLDHWARSRFGVPMDRDAALARGGEVVAPLLAALLEEPYLGREPPKSTGRELFGPEWLDARLAASGAPADIGPHDVLRTLCELTVETAVAAIERFRAAHAGALPVRGRGVQSDSRRAARDPGRSNPRRHDGADRHRSGLGGGCRVRLAGDANAGGRGRQRARRHRRGAGEGSGRGVPGLSGASPVGGAASDGERHAAAAGGGRVRVGDHEPRPLQVFPVVDFRAHEILEAHRVHEQLGALALDHEVVLAGRVLEGESVLESGAAAAFDVNAQ